MSEKRNDVVLFCLYLLSYLFLTFPVLANTIPDRSHSYINVSSPVPADGKTTAIITVTLQDSSGNPVVGNAVSIEDSTNSGATITTVSGITDGSGHAIFSIKSTRSQTDNINVTDTTSKVTFYNLGEVTFTSPGCFDSEPGSSPRLMSAVANGQNQITLTWSSAANPVTRYLVAYGPAAGQYIYGNPNIGGQGTTSYTVGSLTPGKRYYFVVQAINGCTSGNFSNEVSAVAGGVSTVISTPTSTLPIEISPTATNEGNVSPTSMPIRSSLYTEDIRPTTALPTQAPVDNAGRSKSDIIFLISIGIVVGGSAINILYWRHKKKEIDAMLFEEKTF